MNIAVTGASGFIGARLVDALLAGAHHVHVIGRRPHGNLPFSRWEALSDPVPGEGLENADAVIHLAGEPVAQRWNDDARRRIFDSRVSGTRRLVDALGQLKRRPEVLVSGAATGYYGDRGDETLTESSAPGTGFLAGVCREWEQSAVLAETLGIRVVRLRTGLVLGSGGGALERMLPPFRLGAGGKLASGRQWMSWIHVDDLTGLIRHALTDARLSGAVNGTSPEPLRNSGFTKVLASALHRPAVFTVPAIALKLLYGEMAELLLASQRVVPEAARSAGYRYRHPDLAGALEDVLEGARRKP